ncbi:MAG: hypothetical protein KDC54_07995 [Lewinella sp.]|nr:hypothetical protein [Lewinella sp.]
MSSIKAQQMAQLLIDDFNGPQTLLKKRPLMDFLENQSGREKSECRKVAKAILEDREGPRKWVTVPTMAEYLENTIIPADVNDARGRNLRQEKYDDLKNG